MKSTGPRTARGRAVSKMNALKHSLERAEAGMKRTLKLHAQSQ